MFLAEQTEQVMGFAFGLLDRQDAQVGHIGGMWVDPTVRASGVGLHSWLSY
ncbi:MAG: GNAT family N-acetyltransferase, partial [Leptolyngbya sp. SIO1D8]|nr:GNAT family N-acetyltransferase [Leptolyngbya sp. SIO1D8]